MDYNQRWQTIREIGSGGQGKVSLVFDKYRFNTDGLGQAVAEIGKAAVSGIGKTKDSYKSLKDAVARVCEMENPRNQSALKVLHQPQDARDYELSQERMKKEITAMKENQHPNLLKLIDVDDASKWYVTQFYANGTLDKTKKKFTGTLQETLKAIRPVVEAVAELHKKGFVHRDIKPENIFIGYENELILGDFGLVYFEDSLHQRLSQTLENVGSRDWMPLWAQGIRIEEVTTQFDVFCLGKVTYTMVSKSPKLRGWYFDQDEFNLEKMFQDDPSMRLANSLFSKCIKEHKGTGLQNAGDLLGEIDEAIRILERNGSKIEPQKNDIGICKVCGKGKYTLLVDKGDLNAQNFGFVAAGSRSYKVLSCDNCGNVQLFYFDGQNPPPAWK